MNFQYKREIIMQNENLNWQDFDFEEFEESLEKKRIKKQNKRKWREIEAFKEKRIEEKFMDLNDHYHSI